MPLAEVGRRPKGTRASNEFYIRNFSGGLNVADVPEHLGPNDLSGAYNGYLSVGGGFASRYGMTTKGSSLGASAVGNGFRFFQGIKNGAAVSVAYDLVQVGSSLFRADTNANLGSIGSSSPMTWVRFQNPNDPHFVSGLTDCAVICTGTGGPYVWDGTNLYTPAGWSSAAGASWCAFVNGVIWFGGIGTSPNQIFGTGTGQTGDASMETLPATRNFALSGPVTGLAALGTGAQAMLCIGRNNGITVLIGSGPYNFYEQDVPMSDGVTSGNSMIAYSGGILWVGNQAIWTFDGANPPRSISDKIKPYVLNDPYVGGYPITTRSKMQASVYNNRLHLMYCSGVAQTTPNTILVYDFVIGGWTVVQTTPGISALWVQDAPTDPSPWVPVAGSAINGQLYNWDVAPAVGADATDAGAPISWSMATAYFKLGQPGTNKSLRRLYPELFLLGTIGYDVIVNTDYGNSSVTATGVSPAVPAQALWDQALWDVAEWAGSTTWYPAAQFATRVDFDQTDGDSFSFGIQSVGANPPAIVGGFSGLYQSRGMT